VIESNASFLDVDQGQHPASTISSIHTAIISDTAAIIDDTAAAAVVVVADDKMPVAMGTAARHRHLALIRVDTVNHQTVLHT